MKQTHSPFHMALLLALGCVAWRMLSALFPEYVPNASPLMALSFVAGIYFPRKWGWLVGPAACLVTELALIPTSYRAIGVAFPWWALVSLPMYLAAAGLGILISARRSLGKVVAGSVALSICLYVAANTFSWAAGILIPITPSYPGGLQGWWQANSVGLPGYAPSWVFLRNGVIGDLFFLAVFLLVLDRALLFRPATARTASRPA